MENQTDRFEALTGKINSTCKKVDREIELIISHFIEQLDKTKNERENDSRSEG